MTKLVILKTGSKIGSLSNYPGDYEEWIAAGMGISSDSVEVRSIHCGDVLPDPEETAAIVITGSGSMVTEHKPWMLEGEAWLRRAVAVHVPILGICFGHQLLAQALGGEVGYNPFGIEVGTVTIRRTAADDPLFADLPDRFPAHAAHSQSVLRLPRGTRLLANSDGDPHQAFTFGENAWGVQFHPEFNERIVRHYVEAQREQLLAEGKNPDRLLAGCAPTPESCRLLGRFARIAGLLTA